MTSYVARFETRTLQTGIHAEGCSAAQPSRGKRWRKTASLSTIEADSAPEAARKFYEVEAGEERNLPYPHICGCCKSY